MFARNRNYNRVREVVCFNIIITFLTEDLLHVKILREIGVVLKDEQKECD